jgi:hypothetical protein
MKDKPGSQNDIGDELKKAEELASQFAVPSPLIIRPFTTKGNINRHTYLVEAGGSSNRSRHLLQLLNPAVFKRPREVLENMRSCITAQTEALSRGVLPAGREWETLKSVPTKNGDPFLEVLSDETLQCWRMLDFIDDARSFKNLGEIAEPGKRLHTAEEAGRGLALFSRLMAGLDPAGIRCPLPGYHDTGLYYDQLASILEENRTLQEAASYLPADAQLRQAVGDLFLVQLNADEYLCRRRDSKVGQCIETALEKKSVALKLSAGLESGTLKKTVIHGDAKLENFLFHNVTGNVKALVDLDTVMPHSWLSDWGDLMRSLANIAGEREQSIDKIRVDPDIFIATVRAFTEYARPLTRQEIDLMVDAPRIMALELGVRFLADYLRGDTYFSLKPEDPPDVNRTRAAVQFRFAEELARHSAALKDEVRHLFPRMTG